MASSVVVEGNVQELVTSLVTLFLIAVVLRISFLIPKSDLCRLYTLFIFFGYLPFEITRSVTEILSFAGFLTFLVNNHPEFYKFHTRWFVPFVRGFSQTQYKILALFMVFLNYYLYKQPLRFHHYFDTKRLFYVFLAGELVIVAISALGRVAASLSFSCSSRPALVLYLFMQLIVVLPFALMIVFYVLALYTICVYRNQRSREGRSQDHQRRQFISVLIYCTPLNIMNSPNFFLGFLYSYRGITNSNFAPGAVHSIQDTLQDVERYVVNYRIIVVTVCTLLAFEPYRERVFSAHFRRCDPAVVVSTINANSTPTNGGSAGITTN